MLPIDKTYLKTNLINWKTAILDPAYIIQKETLPTASVQNLGKIFQYIGSNSTDYTIGGFYQCQVVPGSDPVEYAWVEVSTKTLIDNTTIQRNANKELYVPKATDAALGVVQAGDGIDVDSDGVISVVARLEEIDELPTATSALEGKIYLLTATQTGYDRGGIYMCEESTETVGTYEWKLISMSPLEAGKGITIEDDVISADTNVFNGTLDEWEALTAEEQAQYTHIATPEEADVTSGYSTTETKTGATWIDGKPIYRRVFEVYKNGVLNGWTRSDTSFTSNEDLSFIDELLSNVAITQNGILMGYSAGTANISYNSGIQRKSTNNFILINEVNGQWTGTKCFLILEYTKTTD